MSSTTTPQAIHPYLIFNGRCDEALKFYQQAIGAEIGMVMHFKDNPDKSGSCPGGMELNPESVMHAEFKVKGSTLMASDGMSQGESKFDNFSLSLTAADEAEAQKFFAALSEGGKVTMPLGKTFYSPCFGMLEDKFGLGWMVIVPGHMA
jgi:PhnB protein